MDPAEVVAKAIRDVWDSPEPGEPDVFPSSLDTAAAALEALKESGFVVVPMPEGMESLVERLESRNRRTPSWSSTYDADAHTLATFLRSTFEL